MVKSLLLMLLICIPSVQAAEVRVAVAANFLATLKAIIPAYENQTGDKVIASSASTGKLYAQITHGAPFDVLLSADKEHPEKLFGLGKTVPGKGFVYAQGQLVLWGGNPGQPLSEHSVARRGRGRFAIANPRTAPYGRVAKQALIRMEQWQKLSPDLVQGESIGQAFQFVASGNVELGLVSLSQVLNPDNPYNKTNYWLVPEDYYTPLQQQAVLLKHGENNSAAMRFLEYLKTAAARKVMAQFGYL